jgi:NNP family nitrate/nitrite transporter-like MFS transporter
MEDQRGAMRALILATLAFAVSFMVWGLIAPLAPTFKDLYGLSATQVGILVAVPVVLGSLARFPLGILSDKYGGRIVFTALLLGMVIPVIVAALTNSFGSLVAISLLLGLAGASFAVGVPFVSRWFPPERQGFALGIYGMGNIGVAISNFVAPRLADSESWRWAFWLQVPLLITMAAVFWLLARNAPGPPAPQVSVAARLAVFLDQPLTWVLALFYFVTFGGFVAIGVYLPTLLTDEYGLTKTDASTRAAIFVVLATLTRPVGGILADRIGATPILNWAFLVVAAFAIVLAFEPGIWVITVAFLAIGAALGLGNGAVFKLVPEYFPKQAGTVTGLVGAAGGLGGFFPPLLMGIVRDSTGSYAIGYMLLSEFALICLIVNVLVLQRGAELLTRASTARDERARAAEQAEMARKEAAAASGGRREPA